MFESLHLSASGFGAIFMMAFIGAVIQGSIGFGLNLVVVPIAAVIQPASLPATFIIMALPMTAGSASLERRHIDRNGVLWMTIGRLPGVVLGAYIVTVLAPASLAVLIGGFVMLAAAMSLISPALRVNRSSSLAAGLVGGVMGTASSIGGPPVALLYQNHAGPILRSTLGATFLIGTFMSLGALVVAGQVAAWHWRLGIALMPAIGCGLFASRFVHRWLDAGWLRPCVLAFAALSGLGVLLHGLL